MTVYADILIVVNLIVDYFLLKISAKVLDEKPKTFRIVLSALLGSLFSLYIFLPQSQFLAELLIRAGMNSILAVACFGFKNIKHFLKSAGVIFGVTCLYAGVMIAVWQILKPGGMIINNSVVYFNISPLVLILCTVAAYLIYSVTGRIFASSEKLAKKCDVTVFADGKTVNATAIVDTGNSITDVFGNSEIIIADKSVLMAIFGNIDVEKNAALRPRYRLIPCSTVSGGGTLDGFRCDKAKITHNGKTITLKKPVLAISKTPLSGSYSLIINPKILNFSGEKNVEFENAVL